MITTDITAKVLTADRIEKTEWRKRLTKKCRVKAELSTTLTVEWIKLTDTVQRIELAEIVEKKLSRTSVKRKNVKFERSASLGMKKGSGPRKIKTATIIILLTARNQSIT